jgi:phage shock protein PspC (stress-responsive transcriptional regulator)
MIPILLAQTDAANNALEGLGVAGSTAGYEDAPGVAELTANLINALLSLLGIAFLLLLIYAGILYMLASGDEEKVKKAKRVIVNAVIGLVLVVSAYAIASFIFTSVLPTVVGTTG